MGRILPIAVFVIGLVILGWWARGDHAERMQKEVQEAASVAIAGEGRHPLDLVVSGRDITISGLAHSQEEKDGLLTALNEVSGRRLVRDRLEVLPRAEDYIIEGVKNENGLVISGVAPSQIQMDTIKNAFPGADTTGLSLASGEPNKDWSRAATGSLKVLDTFETGSLQLKNTDVVVSGNIASRGQKADAEAALARLPQGYAQTSSITTPQGTDLTVKFAVSDGIRSSGTYPKGSDASDVSAVLGLGDPLDEGDLSDPVLAKIAQMRPWMNAFESFTLNVTEQQSRLTAEVSKGVDVATLTRSLKAGLGAGVIDIKSAVAAENDGSERENRLTGAKELLQRGFWLPVDRFSVTAESCRLRVANILGQSQIGFVSGAAELDASSRAVLNRIAGVMTPCLSSDGLRAEVVGHTDSQGGEAANQGLSEERAKAVRAALIERGLPGDMILVRGMGEAEPIADNGSEEGRKANRRIEFRWISKS